MPSNRTIQGIVVAPGLALGPIHICRATPDLIPTYTIPQALVEREIERLHEAISSYREELERRRSIVAKEVGEQDSRILSFHLLILEDPETLRQAEAGIREERINAEASVQAVIDRVEKKLSNVDVTSSRSMAAEMSDPWRSVLELLMQRDRDSVDSAGAKVIIAAHELTPNVVTFLERDRILGVIAEKGGRFSHGAVLARSYGIPCVVGLPNLLSRLEQDMPVSIDGDNGCVQLRPDQTDIDEFLEKSRSRVARTQALEAHADEPALTTDGIPFEVKVNAESLRDLDTIDPDRVDGIGLLRTEFLYMERASFPSEDEQYRLYRRFVEHMRGKPVTIRLLDIGNDKKLSYFQTPKETNPALGWRGIRISLEWQDLLLVQLRAILRASAHGPVRILIPMLTSLEEVRSLHEIFRRVRKQLGDQGHEIAEDVPVGGMVEVPASLLVLENLLEELDFVSVGTNDLVQYLLCADRDNSRVAGLYDPHHPAVLWALQRVAKVAKNAGKGAFLCGEFAGDRIASLTLLGLGYDGVSVAPNFVPEIKYAVRSSSFEDVCGIALRALEQTTCATTRGVFSAARDELDARQSQAEAEDSANSRGTE